MVVVGGGLALTVIAVFFAWRLVKTSQAMWRERAASNDPRESHRSKGEEEQACRQAMILVSKGHPIMDQIGHLVVLGTNLPFVGFGSA